MSNIFDEYTAAQLREIYQEPFEDWPDDFRHFLHDEIAADFLEAWMEQCEEDEYMERVRQVIEDLTYGQEDDDGNIMKEFDIH
jgi:hypothetical protein